MENSTEVACAGCGADLYESASRAVQDRQPCAECGSFARRMIFIAHSEMKFRSGFEYKCKRLGFASGGRRRPVVQGSVRPSWSIRFKEYVTRALHIDREAGLYVERVVRDNGQIIHDCAESLPAHTGHGSAREK